MLRGSRRLPHHRNPDRLPAEALGFRAARTEQIDPVPLDALTGVHHAVKAVMAALQSAYVDSCADRQHCGIGSHHADVCFRPGRCPAFVAVRSRDELHLRYDVREWRARAARRNRNGWNVRSRRAGRQQQQKGKAGEAPDGHYLALSSFVPIQSTPIQAQCRSVGLELVVTPRRVSARRASKA